MSEFLNAIFDGAIIGIICSVAGWVIKKVHDQNEEIEEMFSLLENNEEKLSQCEEKLSQCEEKLSQCEEKLSQLKK